MRLLNFGTRLDVKESPVIFTSTLRMKKEEISFTGTVGTYRRGYVKLFNKLKKMELNQLELNNTRAVIQQELNNRVE